MRKIRGQRTDHYNEERLRDVTSYSLVKC